MKGKYMAMPLFINAVQWDGNNEDEVNDFINKRLKCETTVITCGDKLAFKTSKGEKVELSKGDFLAIKCHTIITMDEKTFKEEFPVKVC